MGCSNERTLDNKIVYNALKENLVLNLLSYNSYDLVPVYEAKFKFSGIDTLENARYYLDDEIMGKDAHTLVINVNKLDEFLKVI